MKGAGWGKTKQDYSSSVGLRIAPGARFVSSDSACTRLFLSSARPRARQSIGANFDAISYQTKLSIEGRYFFQFGTFRVTALTGCGRPARRRRRLGHFPPTRQAVWPQPLYMHSRGCRLRNWRLERNDRSCLSTTRREGCPLWRACRFRGHPRNRSS